MSTNYADPNATRAVVIGPCRCPGQPHETDTADVVVLFGYGDRARIRQAARMAGPEAGYQVAVLVGVKRWNLVLPDGSPRPIDAEQVALLDEGTVDRITDLFDDALRDDPLPNSSSARSQRGRRARSSSTRTSRTNGAQQSMST